MRIACISPTPPYTSGLSFYVLYLYSKFPQQDSIEIITNTDTTAIATKNMKISKIFGPGINAPWECLSRTVEGRPDIVHIHLEYAFLGSRVNLLLAPFFLSVLRIVSGAKIVVTVHGVPTFQSIWSYLAKASSIPLLIRILLTGLFYSISLTAICSVCLLSHATIVHTDLMRRAIVPFMPSDSRSKIFVIPHGAYVPADQRKRDRSGGANKAILTIGYQRPSKGIDTLSKAAGIVSRRMEGVELLIVGRRISNLLESNESLRNWQHEGLPVRVIDRFVPDDELDELIRPTAVIVLPYDDVFYEASGALHRVALLCKPLICSNTPRFFSELVNGREALLFSPEDYTELANHLTTIFEREKYAENLVKNLTKKFAQRGWGAIALRHRELFLRILKHRD